MNNTVGPHIENEEFNEVPELPRRVLATYARLWQFETWLRRMTYIELRALRGDEWDKEMAFPKNSFDADKRLTHMSTPETDALSYAQLATLSNLISDDWVAFACYLPPKSIWSAKLEEISQIRHRIAHFRKCHQDDYRRLIQFLRDIDEGFWKFCTSYNDARPILPATDDPVVSNFLPQDPLPWTKIDEKKWVRIGITRPGLVVGITVEVLRRLWATSEHSICGKAGYLYDVHINGHDGRSFDYEAFLENTKAIHSHVVHIMLDTYARSIRLTMPALLGAERIIGIVDRAIEVAGYAAERLPRRESADRRVQLLADAWPEYVLGPDNPLTFLTPGMKCTFFNTANS